MITRIAIVCLLFSVVFSPSYAAIGDCGDPYILTHHYLTGKLDICSIKDDIGDFEVLTNWGTKPEWLNEKQFVFMGNQIGDVHLMDLETNTIKNLTEPFQHAGFTRAHKLESGDLLLVGPESGPQPPEDPLVIYDKGQFTGSLWVFEAPFDQPPYLLKRKITESVSFLWWQRETTRMENIPAWEGVAVSRESNLIIWSNTQTSFFSDNIIKTGFNYIFKPSSLWVGTFVHRPGSSYMVNTQKIVSKYGIGSVFLEPQMIVPLENIPVPDMMNGRGLHPIIKNPLSKLKKMHQLLKALKQLKYTYTTFPEKQIPDLPISTGITSETMVSVFTNLFFHQVAGMLFLLHWAGEDGNSTHRVTASVLCFLMLRHICQHYHKNSTFRKTERKQTSSPIPDGSSEFDISFIKNEQALIHTTNHKNLT